MDEEKSLNTDSPGDEEKSITKTDNQGNRVDKEKSVEPDN
jgi:hypothetical protein